MNSRDRGSHPYIWMQCQCFFDSGILKQDDCTFKIRVHHMYVYHPIVYLIITASLASWPYNSSYGAAAGLRAMKALGKAAYLKINADCNLREGFHRGMAALCNACQLA